TRRLVPPAASLQIEAVAGVKSDAFLFQQAPLEDVAAIAGQAVGHLALGVDDTVPRDLGCRLKALKDTANKAGTPRHAGHRGDLAVGRNPALGDAADDGANGFDCCIASDSGSLGQRSLRQLASIPGCPALQQSGRCQPEALVRTTHGANSPRVRLCRRAREWTSPSTCRERG